MNRPLSATADGMTGLAGAPSRSASYRWGQLIIGIICMAMIANLQYGWTLFVDPISAKHGWTRAEIQVAFTIFVLTETWLVPIEGYLVDRFGPRPVVLVGGVLCGIGWVMNSFADSLAVLYVAAAVGGVGAGAVYGTCVGNALKWFPDRRGLAAGLTAAGFGAGSAATAAGCGTSAGLATAGAAAGAAAAPAAPIAPISAPTLTVSPGLAVIDSSTPALGAGTSIVTLSVSSSTTGSSAATVSPTFLNHWPIVASVTLSPSVGTRMSVAISYGPSIAA